MTEDIELQSKPNSLKQRCLLLFKLLFGATALYLIIQKANLEEVWQHFKDINIMYVLLAALTLISGQIISALRLRFYLHTIGVHVSAAFAIAINYVGLTFNLIFPGVLGGEGIKTYYTKRYLQVPILTTIRILLANRVNGVTMLGLLTCTLGFFSEAIQTIPYINAVLPVCMFALIVSYSVIAKVFLREPIKVQLRAGQYSFGVQAAVTAAAGFLLLGMGTEEQLAGYLAMFLIATIILLVPLSIGGFGVRELVFVYGAEYFLLDPERGVVLSVLYFFVNMCVSMLGIIFYYKVEHMEPFERSVEQGERYGST